MQSQSSVSRAWMKELTYHEWLRGLFGGRGAAALTPFAPNNFHALPGILLPVAAIMDFNFSGDALRDQPVTRTPLELGR